MEFNPINEFTVWRASPLAVDRHRQMLDRLGTGQTKVDIFTWQKLGVLLIPIEPPVPIKCYVIVPP